MSVQPVVAIDLQIETVRAERDFAASYAKAVEGTPLWRKAAAQRDALAAAVLTLEGVAVLQHHPLLAVTPMPPKVLL